METLKERITIPCCKTVEFVYLDDIIRFEGLQNYTRVFLENGEMLISSNNIGTYKSAMESKGFFCCHKSHIINVAHIKRYYKEGYVEMADTTSVPVSRRRRTVFMERILGNFNTQKKAPLTANISLPFKYRPSLG